MAVTIPKTQYIGINLHRSTDGSMPLGFLTPGGTNAGAKKRISTVVSWVGADSAVLHNIKPADSEQFMLDNPTATMVRDTTDNDQECFRWYHYEIPKVEGKDYKFYDNVENEARFGFRITQSISRGGGWNGGNKVVRIEDPRGFELEISVDNLVKMMTMTTFVDGVCQEKCVWGREGAANILLPVNSEPYKEAFDTTAYRAKQAISLRDVNYGDTVELKKTENFEGLTGIYMGAYHVYSVAPLNDSVDRILAANKGKTYNYDAKDWTFIKTYKRYIIKINVKGKDVYHGVSGCKVHKVIKTVDTPVDRPDISAAIFKDLSGQLCTPIFLSTKKIPVKDVAKAATFVDTDDMDLVHNKDAGTVWIWAYDKESARMMRFHREYYSVHYRNKDDNESDAERKLIFAGQFTRLDIDNNIWDISGTKGEEGKGIVHLIKHPTDKPGLIVSEHKWFQLAFVVNGHEWKVPVRGTYSWE